MIILMNLEKNYYLLAMYSWEKLGPVGETAMATIRGLVRDVIQIISKSLEYLNRYLPSIVAQFIPFIILLLINLVGAF